EIAAHHARQVARLAAVVRRQRRERIDGEDAAAEGQRGQRRQRREICPVHRRSSPAAAVYIRISPSDLPNCTLMPTESGRFLPGSTSLVVPSVSVITHLSFDRFLMPQRVLSVGCWLTSATGVVKS